MLLSHNRGNGYAAFKEAGLAVYNHRRLAAGKRPFAVRHQTVTLPHFINWGLQPRGLREAVVFLDYVLVRREAVLNADVSKAVSKRQTSRLLTEAGIDTPAVITREEAQSLVNEGVSVLGREDGLHSGMGIVVYESGSVVGVHQYYTRLRRRRHEIRVHVGRFSPGEELEVICAQYKNCENVGPVASHANGARFAESQLVSRIGPLTTVRAFDAAKASLTALGLDFAAVDILIDEDTRRPCVLELNTAPGIEVESTRNAYTSFFLDPYR